MTKILLFLTILIGLSTKNFGQNQVINLYKGATPGSENWNWPEAENTKNDWGLRVIYNVAKPTLTVFKPEEGKANGTSIIIAPGGAFRALSIDNEGYEVAKWLVKKGVTCFVLKYRLIKSNTTDPVAEMNAIWGTEKFNQQNMELIPLAIQDGRNAIAYVREHADEMKLDPNRIGIMGFSAGGTVTAGTAYGYTEANKPNFIAPVYAYFPKALQGKLDAKAPPAFILAATDDNLDLASHSVDLYSQWLANKQPAEMHLYAKGGHGFGMASLKLPTDQWTERFTDWLQLNNWLSKSNYNPALKPFEKKSFAFAPDKNLPYRILYPENYDRNKKYPLIMVLHGAGERGNDNEKQLTHGSKMFLSPENRTQYPAIVVFPQCPSNSYWSNSTIDRTKNPIERVFNYNDTSSWPLAASSELVKKIAEEESVDKGRIYITGLSMGGMGTFEAVYRNPNLFAAAAPICGGGNDSLYNSSIKNTSFRVFHGDADVVVNVDLSRKMVARLKELKVPVEYIEYKGVNHNSWDNAFAEPSFMSWLFQHSMKPNKKKNK
ncbi:alpha/beta hydrolase fold domain-containing protein [Sediminibacterium sp.]|uniref:alpha/beta hydrolase fold domain-containing protein n=1 Tax=Sediminibacterium sp. TaxID=1917865 RepID=UPI0025F22011|nr:alpha/beta hydrolase fold domain-containing protein [Sediminibacterium sp.]